LLFRAVRRFLANVAGPEGTLLALDDLQWAGADTFELLTSLFRARETVPLALLGAYRDTDLGPEHQLSAMLGDLARDGLVQRLHIGELDRSEARLLVTSLLGSTPVGPDTIDDILDRAGGVPFFLVSCALALRTSGDCSDVSQIPWDVSQSIHQRIAALPQGARDALDVAAVIGHRVPRSLLVAVMVTLGWDEQEIIYAADTACKVRLLTEHDEPVYEFAHDLIQDVVTRDLGAAYRAMLHDRVAHALESEPGAPPGQLAFHFARGGQAAKARHYLERAGDYAAALHAYAEGETYYRSVAEQLADPHLAAVREKLAGTLSAQAKYQEAIAVLEPALAYYLATQDLEGIARALAALGDAYGGSGASNEGLAQLQSYIERLVAGGLSASGQARLYLTLTELFQLGGRNSEQLAAAQQASYIARRTDDHHMIAEAERQQGLAYLALGQAGKAAEALLGAIHLAEQTGDLWQLSRAVGALAMAKRIQGELSQARSSFERALDIARQIGQPTAIAYLLVLHGELCYLMGDWQQANEDVRLAREVVETIGPSWVSLYPSLGQGLLALAQGNREETERYLEHDAVEAALAEGNLYVLLWAEPNLAERDLLEGRPEAARERLEPWLDHPERIEADVTAILPFLAWAYLELGDLARAESIIAANIDRAIQGQHQNALVDALRVQGLVATHAGRYQEAEEVLRQAIALGEGMPYPHTVAKAQYACGLLYEAEGHAGLATKQLQAALAICQQLGEGLFRVHIEDALRRVSATSLSER
jgi:predicted ATPase